jgi:hypothetical protein
MPYCEGGNWQCGWPPTWLMPNASGAPSAVQTGRAPRAVIQALCGPSPTIYVFSTSRRARGAIRPITSCWSKGR